MFNITRIYSPPNFGEEFFEHNPREIGSAPVKWLKFNRVNISLGEHSTGQAQRLWEKTINREAHS
jgi:hypothetical protein